MSRNRRGAGGPRPRHPVLGHRPGTRPGRSIRFEQYGGQSRQRQNPTNPAMIYKRQANNKKGEPMKSYTVPEAPPERRPSGPPVKEGLEEAYVGKYGRISLDGLVVNVKIVDIRNRYGNMDVLISPMSGSGEKWVQINRIDYVWE